MSKEIEKLLSWDFGDTIGIADGYDTKHIPEATADNMVVMMDKINELIKTINHLQNNNDG